MQNKVIGGSLCLRVVMSTDHIGGCAVALFVLQMDWDDMVSVLKLSNQYYT